MSKTMYNALIEILCLGLLSEAICFGQPIQPSFEWSNRNYLAEYCRVQCKKNQSPENFLAVLLTYRCLQDDIDEKLAHRLANHMGVIINKSSSRYRFFVSAPRESAKLEEQLNLYETITAYVDGDLEFRAESLAPDIRRWIHANEDIAVRIIKLLNTRRSCFVPVSVFGNDVELDDYISLNRKIAASHRRLATLLGMMALERIDQQEYSDSLRLCIGMMRCGELMAKQGTVAEISVICKIIDNACRIASIAVEHGATAVELKDFQRELTSLNSPKFLASLVQMDRLESMCAIKGDMNRWMERSRVFGIDRIVLVENLNKKAVFQQTDAYFEMQWELLNTCEETKSCIEKVSRFNKKWQLGLDEWEDARRQFDDNKQYAAGLFNKHAIFVPIEKFSKAVEGVLSLEHPVEDDR